MGVMVKLGIILLVNLNSAYVKNDYQCICALRHKVDEIDPWSAAWPNGQENIFS
jgi:hypothetical protein